MTKFLSVHNKKGGVGKTAVAVLKAVYLSKFGKTCLIDADESGNATKRFTIEINETAKLSRLFRKQEVFPMQVRENLDLVCGSAELEQVNTELVSRMNNTLVFANYLRQYETFNQYDYVVIDTRNDSNLITNNMLVASDLILGISDPSADGFEALIYLEQHVKWLGAELTDLFTGQSYVHANVRFLGNKLAHNTDVSKQFKQVIAQTPTFIGYLQDRTAFDEAGLQRISLLDLFEQTKYQQAKYNRFKADTYQVLAAIKNCLDA
ncbi:ParA family protein [Enterococcus sp. DIV1420a]|uniref:ParA family protein n=1 Tax=Enterococcus sp. DIV1420a TaxID=2774672 RepID=UPI003F263E74